MKTILGKAIAEQFYRGRINSLGKARRKPEDDREVALFFASYGMAERYDKSINSITDEMCYLDSLLTLMRKSKV